jgi:hypothetical protein
MEATHKVLIIDKSIDRKNRIGALKERGFAVFPALRLAEARSRCRPGAYDLVIVNAQDELEMAIAFCDSLRARTPAQPVLLLVSGAAQLPERDYVVAEDPKRLAEAVERMLGGAEGTAELSSGEREDVPERASA